MGGVKYVWFFECLVDFLIYFFLRLVFVGLPLSDFNFFERESERGGGFCVLCVSDD